MPPALFITGPTGSGKSALALGLAQALKGTVINADSMQVYRGLACLTAQPTKQERKLVPHALYGFLPMRESYSAWSWRRAALRALSRARCQGRLPILVGGSGLYLRGLVQGLSHIPQIPKEVRLLGRERFAQEGAESLFAELCAQDPSRQDPGLADKPMPDKQRLLRMWEVWKGSGKPLSFWHQHSRPRSRIRVKIIWLLPPRAEVYKRAESRFLQMLSTGALEEARELQEQLQDQQAQQAPLNGLGNEPLNEQGLPAETPAWKALGLSHLLAHLRGELSLAEATVLSQRDTRHYIKRQEIWLRQTGPKEKPSLILRKTDCSQNIQQVLAYLVQASGQGTRSATERA